MSKAAKDAAERMSRVLSGGTSRSGSASVGAAENSTKQGASTRSRGRTSPVRLSVDLAPVAYQWLVAWCTQAAPSLGRARVSNVDVMRALVEEMRGDVQLQQRVLGRLEQQD